MLRDAIPVGLAVCDAILQLSGILLQNGGILLQWRGLSIHLCLAPLQKVRSRITFPLDALQFSDVGYQIPVTVMRIPATEKHKRSTETACRFPVRYDGGTAWYNRFPVRLEGFPEKASRFPEKR